MSMGFALFGAGRFGKNHLRLLAAFSGVSLRYVVTREKRIDVALPRGVRHTADVRAALRDPAVDCVVIATPPKTHAALALSAIRAGKHVLVEKPMVTSVAEARQLARALKRQPVTFMVGYQYLFNSAVRYLKKLLDHGTLGAIRHVHTEHLVSPPREDVSAFLDAAPHPLSIMHYLFNPGAIREVCGVSYRSTGKGPDDFTVASVRFSRGPLLTMTTSWLGAEKTRRFTFVGERATAVLDETLPDKKLTITYANGRVQTPKLPASEPLRNKLGHFIRCVRIGKRPLADIAFGSRITADLEYISKKLT